MAAIWAILLCATVLVGWMLTLLGLPGNWLIFAATAIYAYLLPSDSPLAIGWQVVAFDAALALLGEAIELLASAMGVSKAGGSRRSAVLALIGSVAGGITGVFVGLPVPVIGSLIAAVLFAGVGALAGAMHGERSAGRGLNASWQVGKAAFWGRLFGTLAKILIGSVMVAITLAALVL